MNARDLPELRARTVADIDRLDQLVATETHPELRRLDRKLRATQYGPAGVAAHWRMAELFFVTAEMANLAAEAEKSMPGFTLHRDDLPAESGLMVFDTPWPRLSTWPVTVWGPNWDSGGVTVTLYSVNLSEVIRVFSATIGYGDEDRIVADSEDDRKWVRVTRCAWLLMQQSVAAETTEHPDRASSRRLQRRGVTDTKIRVISLRHRSAHGVGDGAREYHHQWVVRGHWRKQWYASQDRHVPIWISPHIKGPDGAPMLGGEKVYAWRR